MAGSKPTSNKSSQTTSLDKKTVNTKGLASSGSSKSASSPKVRKAESQKAQTKKANKILNMDIGKILQKVSDEEIEEALLNNYGILSYVAQVVGLRRETVSKRVNRSPRLKALRDHCRESAIDTVEHELIQLAKNGKEETRVKVNMFLAKTLGKKRGYSERVEIHNLNPEEAVAEQLSDEELLRNIRDEDPEYTSPSEELDASNAIH